MQRINYLSNYMGDIDSAILSNLFYCCQ